MVTRWFVLRTALLFIRSAVRLAYAELPGPAAVCLPKHALCELGDRVLGGDRTVESSARRPHRSLPHRATPATVYQPRPKANPGTRTDTHDRVRTDRVDGAGSVTLRVAGRLHHIGVGRTHARTRALILIVVHDLNIRVIKATTGELLRDLILDPTCDYQPTGAPKVALIAPPTPRPPTSIGTGIWPNRSRNAGSRNSV